MADTRYLKRRRQTWFLCLAVPSDLRSKVGKSAIVETLGTRDLTKAQTLRWPKVSQWTEAFERLRGNIALTTSEIEEHAQRFFQSWLVHLDDVSKQAGTDADDEIEQLGIQADLLRDAAEVEGPARGSQPAIAHEIAEIAKRTGAEIALGSPIYRQLEDALFRAMLHATLGRQKALADEEYRPPVTFGALPTINPVTLRPVKRSAAKPRGSSNGMRFSEAAERFLAELQRDETAKKTEQTRAQHEAVYRLFAQYVSDAALEDITRQKAAEFLADVAKLHPHWGRSPETKKLTIWELLDKHGKGDGQLSNTTLNRYVSSLGAVFKWARKRGLFDEAKANPFAEQSFEKPPMKERLWLPYNTNELNKLLNSPLLVDTPREKRIRPDHHDARSAMLWLPFMALFTGMRSGELCQLHTSDLMRDAETGIWFFRVHAEREMQSLKTEAAERRVPVHSQLIAGGLLKYRQALANGQLFPGLKPGGPDNKLNHYFTKRFTDHRRSVGVDRPRVSFHSFRKNAAQSLKDARTTPAEIAELIGHERGFTVETYAPLGLPLSVLRELVERIEYPKLQLDHLTK